MKVLIACEFSGIVRDAFIARGHDAWSCDLLPTERPGPHLQCDVLTVLDRDWDLMIAHPDCTYLTNAANRWLYDNRYPDRFEKRELAIQFFEKLIKAPIPKKATENPIPHGALIARVGKYSQTIQPYQFGEDASKRTCLWLYELPKLQPTSYFPPRRVEYKGKLVDRWGNQTVGGSNKYGPSADRWMKRARTFQGIAEAMADQWGELMSKDYFSIPGYDAWKTRAPEDEPGYWDGRERDEEYEYQSRKAAKKRETEQEWIFTFGFGHTHPVTGESLANCYTTIMGDLNTTRAVMTERFGNKWAFQYPSKEEAGVEKYNLRYVEFPDECPF